MSTKRKDLLYYHDNKHENNEKLKLNSIIYNENNIEKENLNQDNGNSIEENYIPIKKRVRTVSFGDIKVMHFVQDQPIIAIDDDLENSYSIDSYREMILYQVPEEESDYYIIRLDKEIPKVYFHILEAMFSVEIEIILNTQCWYNFWKTKKTLLTVESKYDNIESNKLYNYNDDTDYNSDY